VLIQILPWSQLLIDPVDLLLDWRDDSISGGKRRARTRRNGCWHHFLTNTRKSNDQSCFMEAMSSILGKRVEYKDLIG